MGPSKSGAKIDVVASSGMLRVTVHPRPRWFVLLIEIGVISAFVAMIYGSWPKMSLLFHTVFIGGAISAALALVYQLSGSQVVEFDQQRLTTCKEIHGWERKREYKVEDCSELQWAEATEDEPSRLKCKVGWKTVGVCEGLSEEEAVEILVALQKYLPEAAQKMCSYPNSKEHFLTLGLGKK
jgi:hypothetical protein